MKPNNIILQTAAKTSVFIILAFSIHLFLAGHHSPGGGFIGGLVAASALVLSYMAFGLETVRQIIPLNFKRVAALGVLLALLTGLSSLIWGKPFLNQVFGVITLPLLGETELASAILFDIGVALAVLGTAMTIILSISEDH